MQKIINKLQGVKADGKIGLMTHAVTGYPDLETTEKLVLEMAENGADLIELQIPFSDPIADGPTIMRASQVALEHKVKVKDAFNLAQKLTQKIDVPLLFMTYANILEQYGYAQFCSDAKQAGISGLIVPDIPPEEAGEYLSACKQSELAPIFIMAPTSTNERLEKIAAVAQGFIYCVARTGVTGAETDFNTELADFLKRCRKYTVLPLGVGFGINKKSDLDFLQGKAEFGIIGSQLIRVYDKNKNVKAVGEFLRALK